MTTVAYLMPMNSLYVGFPTYFRRKGYANSALLTIDIPKNLLDVGEA